MAIFLYNNFFVMLSRQCIELLKRELIYSLLVFIIVCILVKKSMQWFNYVRTLPPGPWGLPILGYLPFIKGDLHVLFGQLAAKYGSVFSVRLGSHLVVVLSDYSIIRRSFRMPEFSGRPHNEFMKILGGYGIINTEGKMWEDQRKFVHEKLRLFGMTSLAKGKRMMESRITREVESLMHGFAAKRGAATEISSSFGMAISNVICSVIMSVRFYPGDRRFSRFMALIDEGFRLFGSVVTVNFIPIMRYFPFLRQVRNKIAQNREEMAAFFQQTIDEHRQTFNHEKTRDLVDAYLAEIENAKAQGKETELFQGKDHDRQIQQILGDLFSAGMETVKTTLEWAVIWMLHHPEVARAVQNELDQTIGRSRLPTLDDVEALPFTNATILEIMRKSTILPLGTPHATTRDIVLNGYTIPAGTQIMALLDAVHMNPSQWGDPEEFRPERFLSPVGKVTKPEYFMPFGVGRRMCLGDVLARMEVFLFFSTLLHTFHIKLPQGDKLPSLHGNVGITVTPGAFRVCLDQRPLEPIDCQLDLMQMNAVSPLRNVGSH